MTAAITRRNHSLTGPEAARAAKRGLVDAAWFQPRVVPSVLRDLQQRSDGRAARDTVLWLALIVVSAWVAWWSLGVDGVISVQAIPAFVVYGALYGGSADARWHECGHGTAFKSRWANEVVYHLACFMLWRGPTLWRWSHHRHHTDTIIVGRDAEIAYPRPTSVWRAAWMFVHLEGSARLFGRLVRHATVGLDADALDLIPTIDRRRAVWEARVIVGSVLLVVAWAISIGSIVPLLFIGLPTVYGGWLMVFFGMTQHAGLRDDVLDHRLNSRTVMMNPILRFLYLNMNFHVEHHLFPSVPYQSLPRLHDEIADQLAPPLRSTWAAYRSIIGALWHQRRDAGWEIPLSVPEVAGVVPERIEVGEKLWVRSAGSQVAVARVGDLEVGDMRRVDRGGETFVLCRVADDEFRLLDGMCTHAKVHMAGGALLTSRDRCELECPKHNARFDVVSGEPTRAPARLALGVYDVRVVDGRVMTAFERVFADDVE